MRLTAKQKRLVLDACASTRPGAKLVRKGEHWLAVWHVVRDVLVDPEVRVPAYAQWRAQAVANIESDGVWWNGVEAQASTRRAAIEEAIS